MSQAGLQQNRRRGGIRPASCEEAFTEVEPLSRFQVLAFLLPDACARVPPLLDALACFHLDASKGLKGER